jgi:hypothetical protein
MIFVCFHPFLEVPKLKGCGIFICFGILFSFFFLFAKADLVVSMMRNLKYFPYFNSRNFQLIVLC